MWDSASTMIFVSIKCWEIGWFSCLCRKILWVPRVFSSCWLVVEFRYSEKGCITSRIMKTRWKWLKFDYQFTQRIKISAAGREGLTSGHTRREPHNDLNYDRCLRGKFVCGLGSVGPLGFAWAARCDNSIFHLSRGVTRVDKEGEKLHVCSSVSLDAEVMPNGVRDWLRCQSGWNGMDRVMFGITLKFRRWLYRVSHLLVDFLGWLGICAFCCQPESA